MQVLMFKEKIDYFVLINKVGEAGYPVAATKKAKSTGVSYRVLLSCRLQHNTI